MELKPVLENVHGKSDFEKYLLWIKKNWKLFPKEKKKREKIKASTKMKL